MYRNFMTRTPDSSPMPSQNSEVNPNVQRFIEGVDLTNQEAVKQKIAQLRQSIRELSNEEHNANQEGRMAFPSQDSRPEPGQDSVRKTTFRDFSHDASQFTEQRQALNEAVAFLESKLQG